MGNSCHFCMNNHSTVSNNEIESVERKSNMDVMSSIILIQKNWRGYQSRKSNKFDEEKLSSEIRDTQEGIILNMKCCYYECFNSSQFVCLCESNQFYCLTHLYYHIETCKKQKKTWNDYFEKSMRLNKDLKLARTQIISDGRALVETVQSLTSASLNEIDSLKNKIKVFDDNYNRPLLSKVQDTCQNFKKIALKVTQIINDCLDQIKGCSMSDMHIRKTSSASNTGFISDDPMDDDLSNCQYCERIISSAESLLIQCKNDLFCTLCISCRKLDSSQCIACSRYYTSHEHKVLSDRQN